MKKQGPEPAVKVEPGSVKIWRKRFYEVYERFSDLTLKALAQELAKVNPAFEGATGVERLTNIKRGKAGRDITDLAVDIMEKLRPTMTKKPSLLGRQKLHKA